MGPESCLNAHQLITQFLQALRELPQVHADLAPLAPGGLAADRGHDAQIALKIVLQVAGKPFTLLIQARKALYPRDVRQVLWQLRQAGQGLSASQGKKLLPLLVAQSISAGAKELLKEEGVGYYDSGGSLYLPAPGAYIYIDKPPPKSLAKSVRALFSGARAQVLHAILLQPQEWFGVKALAQRAMVSAATASQVLTELERLDWVVPRGQGPSKQRQLGEPAALLDAWAKQLASLGPLSLRRYYVPAMKADTLLGRVGEVFDAHDAGYAISHEAAAQRYCPFLSSVSQVRVRLHTGLNADAAIGELGARVVNEGANLAIIEAKSPGDLLFRQQVAGIWLASPVQVYLDLLRGEGRAKEMAEHLRQERIGF